MTDEELDQATEEYRKLRIAGLSEAEAALCIDSMFLNGPEQGDLASLCLCPNCQGRGHIWTSVSEPPTESTYPCFLCNGSGAVPAHANRWYCEDHLKLKEFWDDAHRQEGFHSRDQGCCGTSSAEKGKAR